MTFGVALDSNVILHAMGINDAARHARAVDLIERLPRETVVLPVQVLGETMNVLISRKVGRERSRVRDVVARWDALFGVHETSPSAMLAAADLVADHGLQVWDAVILAVAAEAGCRLLLVRRHASRLRPEGRHRRQPVPRRRPPAAARRTCRRRLIRPDHGPVHSFPTV
ncbi:PIN domain-containing protein [Azospirillum halopraeferens]|uniref:PIN domain-containing protein n=1 Tax=Azospirillum halopraeferens TaxID=34010 RepID=UPI000427CB03|nr:PIN domain-containing protein [Azospirillum halopraeferens]